MSIRYFSVLHYVNYDIPFYIRDIIFHEYLLIDVKYLVF